MEIMYICSLVIFLFQKDVFLSYIINKSNILGFGYKIEKVLLLRKIF